MGRPSLHAYDPTEEYAPLCEEMAAAATAAHGPAAAASGGTRVLRHAAGHMVPQDAATLASVAEFVRAQLELDVSK